MYRLPNMSRELGANAWIKRNDLVMTTGRPRATTPCVPWSGEVWFACEGEGDCCEFYTVKKISPKWFRFGLSIWKIYVLQKRNLR